MTTIEPLLHRPLPRRHRGYIIQTRPFVLLHAARIYRACNDTDAAMVVLRQAKALQPPSPDPSFRLTIEQALLEDRRDLLDAEWGTMPDWARQSIIFRALYARALFELGDPQPLQALADSQPIWDGLDLAEIARRIPY